MEFLRGDFLENRVFFTKCAQNLATRPSSKICFAAILVLNFLSNLRKETKFSWIVAKVEKAKRCKQNEKCPGKCNVILYFGVF